MKKHALYFVFTVLVASGGYLFGQQGKVNADHRELQEHYNSCSRVINEIRDARRSFAVGTSGTWGIHKKQVLDDLQRAEMSLYQYRQELERADVNILRSDLRPEVR
jgi:hypothetical protein